MRIVLAITGASGSPYALRLLEVLRAAGCEVHLTISPAAVQVLRQEVGVTVDLDHFDLAQLLPTEESPPPTNAPPTAGAGPPLPPPHQRGENAAQPSTLHSPLSTPTYHHYLDFSAGIASGSYPTDGMVICPCSMGTLAAVAHGLSSNLIQRAADVHLKERRTLIVVPRETPLGSIQLENMKRLADAGAVILPAMPGFYHRPTSIQDLIDFLVGRVCDQLGVRQELVRRWGEGQEAVGSRQ